MIGIAFPISTFIWSIFIDKATIGILSNEWKIAALWLGGILFLVYSEYT